MDDLTTMESGTLVSEIQAPLLLATAGKLKPESVNRGLDALRELARRLAAAEAKLRRTADSVLVGPGDRLYPLHSLADGLCPEEAADIDDFATIVLAAKCNESGEVFFEDGDLDISKNYSTREAALAARQPKAEGQRGSDE